MRLILKGSKEIFSLLRWGDFVIVALVLLFSGVLFLKGFFPAEALKAEIYLDGEIVLSLELDSLDEGEKHSVGGCELLCEKDGVTFLSSECSDKLCVNRGKLTRAGDTMACVPERVTVVLKASKGNGFDAVVF